MSGAIGVTELMHLKLSCVVSKICKAVAKLKSWLPKYKTNKTSDLSVKLPHDSTSQPVQMEMQLCTLESVLSVGSHDGIMLAKSFRRATESPIQNHNSSVLLK